MEEGVIGTYAYYLLQPSTFLLNDKADTYKIKQSLNSSSKLTISILDIPDFLDLKHLKFTFTLYYKSTFKVNKDDGNEVTRQPSDYRELKDVQPEESKEYPKLERDYEHIEIVGELSGKNINIPLWDTENNKALFQKNDLISRWVDISITYDTSVPYIDIRNGIANEPYEILVDSFEELKKIITYATRDKLLHVIRLDSNKTYYFPETLHIKKGQNIEIRGGNGEWIKNEDKSVHNGKTVLDGSKVGKSVETGLNERRLFIVEAGGQLTLTNMHLRNCNCNNAEYDKGKGGAILVESVRRIDGVPEFGILTCTDCVFLENKAWNGGAIFSYHAGLFLDGCDFILNESAMYGGAVYYWARDVRLEFPNLVSENGKVITLLLKVTDYLARPVLEGEVDFYLKQGKKETFIETVNVNEYTDLHLKQKYGLDYIPTVGTLKQVITEYDETKQSIITLNGIPQTYTKDGKIYLKKLYDETDGFKQVELKKGIKLKFGNIEKTFDEKKTLVVLKKQIEIKKNNGEKEIIKLPTYYNEKDQKTYLNYNDPTLLKFIVYLDEITNKDHIPSNAELKIGQTDDPTETEWNIITKDGKPVTMYDSNNNVILKPTYDSEYKPITLDPESGEVLTKGVVFKNKAEFDKIDPETGEIEYENGKPKKHMVALPTVIHQNQSVGDAEGTTHLKFSDPTLINYLVYNQVIDENKVRGWVSYDYKIPDDNKDRVLQFVAHYRAGATYEDEVAVNTVDVIFPEKYTATFVDSDKGTVGTTLTIRVKVTNEQQTVIFEPQGIFTIDKVKYNAQHDGTNYTLKYKIDEKYNSNKLPIKFELKESIHYKCEPVTIEMTLSEPEKGQEENAPVNFTGIFINTTNLQLKTGSTTDYIDTYITDSLVKGWETNGITDIFVRCINYEDSKNKALLTTVLDKIKSLKLEKKFRVHAVVNVFYNADGTTTKECWTNVNPTVESRKTFVLKQIELLLKNTAINGICFDYNRFNGSTSSEVNGKVDKEKRSVHITSAMKSFNEKVEKVKKQTYVSMTVMPEENAMVDYGQNFKELAKHVDFLMPLAYIGDYEGVSKGKDSWLSDVIKLLKDNEVPLDKIVTVIQTYKDWKTLENKQKINKVADALRTKETMDATIKEIAKNKIRGNCLFREGLIPKDKDGKLQYPVTYKSALGVKETTTTTNNTTTDNTTNTTNTTNTNTNTTNTTTTTNNNGG